MRIGVVVDVFPTFSETFVLDQITGLIDHGHEVFIFTGVRPPWDQEPPEAFEKYGLKDRVHSFEDRPPSWLGRLLCFLPLLLLADPSSRRHLWRSLNVVRYGREAASLKLFFKVRTLTMAGNMDIWQCHFGPNGERVVRLKELGISGRVVTMFHGYDVRAAEKDAGARYRRLAAEGDWFLAVCAYTRERLLAFGFPGDRTSIFRLGVDIKRFTPREGNYRKDAVPRIVTVARLVPEKDIANAIEALSRCRELAWEYVIVGDGRCRTELERAVNAQGLSGRIMFAGQKEPEEVAAVLGRADIFLLPSRDEAFPVSIMEAMAMGLPVVATDVGGVRELVRQGVSGSLVPPADPEALAVRLKELLVSPEKRAAFGKAGRLIVEQELDQKRLIEELEDLYARVTMITPRALEGAAGKGLNREGSV